MRPDTGEILESLDGLNIPVSATIVAETGIFNPSRLSRISPVSGLIIFTWLSSQLDNIT
mgnify:CR=1 FL=1